MFCYLVLECGVWLFEFAGVGVLGCLLVVWVLRLRACFTCDLLCVLLPWLIALRLLCGFGC